MIFYDQFKHGVGPIWVKSNVLVKIGSMVNIWSSELQKQKIGTTIIFPEGLENTPLFIQSFALELAVKN